MDCNYMKLSFFLISLFISVLVYSQTEMQEFERLDFEKVKNDVDSIRMEMDSTLFYINATYDVLKQTVKLYGLKKTIHILINTFYPFLIFVGLYLLWLIKRKP